MSSKIFLCLLLLILFLLSSSYYTKLDELTLSTGSIIAAGLAKGMSAQELVDLYKEKGEFIFTPVKYTEKDIDQLLKNFGITSWLLRGTINNFLKVSGLQQKIAQYLLTKYSGKELEEQLKTSLGENMTLGSSDLKTNLMIVTNNLTYGGTWFFVNNIVRGEYKNENIFLKRNANIPIWKIVRSSSAAPTFFPPYSLKIAEKEYEFIDGGISSYNNPSFELFLEAVNPNYGTNWNSGVDQLLLVSIGAGFTYPNVDFGQGKKKNNLDWIQYIIGNLMYGSNLQQNQLIKLISKQNKKSNSKRQENSENLKLSDEKSELMTYCRFNISFEEERFKKLINAGILELKDENNNPITADKITQSFVSKFEQIDCVDQIDNLIAIGRAVAEDQFDLSLFEGFLED